MTPRERFSRAIRGIKPDKLPLVVINSNSFMCSYYGISVEEYLSEPASCADVNIRFIEEFGVDCTLVATGYILYGAGPELGVRWGFAGSNFPGNIEGPIKTESDLKDFQVPAAPSGYFKNYLETMRIVNEAIGDTHHLKASFLGPFSLACFLHGLEQTLIDMTVNRELFTAIMKLCTELSVFLGRQMLSTGLRYPILNEIFLAPEMVKPDDYHRLIFRHDLEVQRRLGPEVASNCFCFMGLPGDHESQEIDKAFYAAFFGVGESLAAVKKAGRYRAPGFPFPAAVSGRALTNWSADRILAFLREVLGCLLAENILYPSISLSSVQAESKESALSIASKIKAVQAFRDGYNLY